MPRENSDVTPGFPSWAGTRRNHGDYLDWNLWGSWPGLFRRAGAPTMDMYETKDNVIIEADVPGFRPEDISVQITPHALTMRGETKIEKDDKDEDYVLKERGFGQFYRTIRFPTQVKADETRATYRDGVLRVVAPKMTQEPHGIRHVPIEKDEP